MELDVTGRSKNSRRVLAGLFPLFTLFPLFVGALQATPASAAQQNNDTILLRDGKTETGKIKSEEFAGIAFAPTKGPERTIEWSQVQPNGITYGGSPEFTSAKESFDAQKFDEALPKLAELKAEAKLRDVLKQNVAYYTATILQRKGDCEKAIEEYKGLYKAFPKSRYLMEIGEALVACYVAKGKDYAGATKALDDLSSTALENNIESGFGSAMNVLKGRIFEEQQKWSEAIGAYSVAEKATGVPQAVVQQARLGQARCLVAPGINKQAEAETIFRKLVTEEASGPVHSGAWNGIGDLTKKQGFDKKDSAILLEALYAYLRGVVQYAPLPGEPTHEYERSLAGAAQCFKYIADVEKSDKAKSYGDYSRQRWDQLAKEFPNSPFLKAR